MPAPHVTVADGNRIEGRIIGVADPTIEVRIFDIEYEEQLARGGHSPAKQRERASKAYILLDDLATADLTNWLSILARKLVLAKHAAEQELRREDGVRAEFERGASRLPTWQEVPALTDKQKDWLVGDGPTPIPVPAIPAELLAVLTRVRAAGPGEAVEVTAEEDEAWADLERMSTVPLHRELDRDTA